MFSTKTLKYRELRKILQLTLPMWLTQLLQMGHGLVDTIMAGHLGTPAMAAVAIGSGLWLPVLLFMQGVLLSSLPMFSQACGRRQWSILPQILHQTLYIGLILAVLTSALLLLIPYFFSKIHIQATMAVNVESYLHGILLGTPAVASFLVLRYYSEAQSRVLPVTLISGITLILNIPLNHIMMYGYGWIPALGGAGCGYATACVYWLGFILLLLWISFSSDYHRSRWYTAIKYPQPKHLLKILRLGLPLGAALFFEVSAFTLIAVLLAPLGALAVAGHQIALSIASFLFMLPLALSNALTIRTSFHFASHAFKDMHALLRTAFYLSTTVACSNALGVLMLRPWIPHLYTQDPHVIALSQRLLLYTAAFQIFDGVQVCITGVLRGIHDTKGPFWITLFSYWILTLPLGYLLGMTPLTGHALGAEGYWSALVLGLATAAILLGIRLKHKLHRIQTQHIRTS